MLDEDRYLAQICGLAANPSLPQPLLDRLVTAASGERPASGNLAQRIALADREPRVSPRPPTDMACDPDSAAYIDVAQQPNTTADALQLCLRHPAARRHAARHPNLPPHVITELLNDPDLLVAEAAAANPALPRRIMEALLT